MTKTNYKNSRRTSEYRDVDADLADLSDQLNRMLDDKNSALSLAIKDGKKVPCLVPFLEMFEESKAGSAKPALESPPSNSDVDSVPKC